MNERQLILNIEKVILPPDRLRAVDPERVAEIALSMAQAGGQITPIEVGPADAEGRHFLISGAHRLAALRRNGEAEVMAVVFDGNAQERRLREIDENLYRHDLTPYDQAAFMAERLVIWEALYGQRMQAGGDPKKHSAKLAKAGGKRFYVEVAAAFGLPERTARRMLARWKKIDREAWRLLRGHAVTRNGTDLDALARLEPGLQNRIAALLVRGDVATVAAAKKQLGIGSGAGAPDPLDAVSRGFEKLTAAKKAAFVKRHFETLVSIMKKGGFA